MEFSVIFTSDDRIVEMPLALVGTNAARMIRDDCGVDLAWDVIDASVNPVSAYTILVEVRTGWGLGEPGTLIRLGAFLWCLLAVYLLFVGIFLSHRWGGY